MSPVQVTILPLDTGTAAAAPLVDHVYIKQIEQSQNSAPAVSEPTAVDAAAFGMRANGEDCTAALAAVLEHCRARGARRLVFPRGRYVFRSEVAAEQDVFISNNDGGRRRIAFLLRNFADLEIDGQGSEFIFHGQIIPFVVENSARIAIKNLAVDWDVPFHCEGKVIASDDLGIDLEIPERFPYEITGGHFQSLGPGAAGWTVRHLLEFDPVKGETACGAADIYPVEGKFHFEEIGPRRVRFVGPISGRRPQPGNVLLITDTLRTCPAFFISDSESCILRDVSIFHAGAMGVIAQRSADLSLTRVRVMPRPGGGQVISALADATHFASCRGRIELSDCTFRTQVDDATNVHGIYTRISSRTGEYGVTVQLVHPQQRGTNPIAPGHRLQFVSHQTLAPICEATVTEVKRLDDEYVQLGFSEPLSAAVRENDAVFDLFWQPTETVIRRCTISGNRARGMLLSAGGRILVEGCKFHTPGAAILIEGDANFWFEAGPVSDVTIIRNEFDNCNYGPWGRAAIQISPGIKDPFHAEPRYHRNVRIEDNRFTVFFPTLLQAQDIDGLRFTGNLVAHSTDYPAKQPEAARFVIHHCSNTEVNEPS